MLSGLIPSSLAEATTLQMLHIGYNRVRGQTSFHKFGESRHCALEFLVLAENDLTGTCPFDSIAANCSNMNTLNLGASGFIGGNIPSVGFEQLIALDLQEMELTGSIPDLISRLTLLEVLLLDFNDLEGTVPESLGQLGGLTELSLSYNRLDGTIPSSLGLLQELRILDMRMNLLSGVFPSELGLCTNLELAQFERNFLSGDIVFFCPLDPVLSILSSDCSFDGVVCSCCTACF